MQLNENDLNVILKMRIEKINEKLSEMSKQMIDFSQTTDIQMSNLQANIHLLSNILKN